MTVIQSIALNVVARHSKLLPHLWNYLLSYSMKSSYTEWTLLNGSVDEFSIEFRSFPLRSLFPLPFSSSSLDSFIFRWCKLLWNVCVNLSNFYESFFPPSMVLIVLRFIHGDRWSSKCRHLFSLFFFYLVGVMREREREKLQKVRNKIISLYYTSHYCWRRAIWSHIACCAVLRKKVK